MVVRFVEFVLGFALMISAALIAGFSSAPHPSFYILLTMMVAAFLLGRVSRG